MGPSVQEGPRVQGRRLADELRRLRGLSGLSGRQLARQMGTSQSKVSRIESGLAIPSLPQVTAWASAVGAPDATRESLLALTRAAFTEAESWREVLREQPHVQGEVQEFESRARMLRTFQPSVVPGLLQTAEYARRVFSLGLAPFTGGDVPGSVAARLNRQLALYEKDKRFRFLITEAALRWRPGPTSLLLAQLDRIASVSTLENVSVGVIPLGVQAVAMLTHAFVIFDGPGHQDTLVSVETIHCHLLVRKPADVALYQQRWDMVNEMAISGTQARDFIRDLIADVKAAPG